MPLLGMRGGRHHGRGGRRGGRGAGGRGKSRGFNAGPTLPSKLRILTAGEGGEPSPSGAGVEPGSVTRGLRGSNSTSEDGQFGVSNRKARRKAERLQRKQAKCAKPGKSSSRGGAARPEGGKHQSSFGRKRKREDDSKELQSKAKRGGTRNGATLSSAAPVHALSSDNKSKSAKRGSSAKSAWDRNRVASKGPSRRTKFQELLEDDPSLLSSGGSVAQKAELRLQNELAKKMKLKGRKLKDAGDGLDDLLAGIDEGSFGGSESELSGDVGAERLEGEEDSSVDDGDGGGDSDDEEGMMSDDDEDMMSGDDEEDGMGDEKDERASTRLKGGSFPSDAVGSSSSDIDEEDSDCEDSGLENTGSGEEAQKPEASEGEHLPASAGGKYVPPAARARAAVGGSREDERVVRRVRGLLNRLAEANLQGIVGDLVELYNSSARRLVRDTAFECILQAVEEGPRATEQFTAIAAAFVAGLAAVLKSQELAATFMGRAAPALQSALAAEDSLACNNLASLLAHLFCCGVVQAATLFGLLGSMVEDLGEGEVSVICTILRSCGLQLRNSDPEEMKAFVLKVHTRTAEKANDGTLSKRAELMMKMIVDVKNNKQRDWNKQKSHLPLSVSKWLRQVGVDEVQLRSLPWTKLTDENRRKGVWWLPSHDEVLPGARKLDGGSLHGLELGTDEGVNLMQAAAEQRMNTDARRAVFCCVMGADDYMDAFERLLRLPLKAQQEREIVRVVVECCLQEESFNPYYAALLGKLVAVSKNHKVTLQFCLWDQFKEVEEMSVRRSTNLARLTGHILGSFALSLTTLKVVDFSDQMSPRMSLFWQVTMMYTLLGFGQEDDVKQAFLKLAGQSKLGGLQDGMLGFFQKRFGPWLADRPTTSDAEAARASRALKRLRTVEKILLKAKQVRL